MKVKPADLVREFSQQREKIRLVLICGPDIGRCESTASALTRDMGAEAERVDISAEQLAKDPSALRGEAKAISMFAESRYIFARVQGRETTAAGKAIDMLLADDPGGDPVIICAPGMSDKLAMPKAVAKAPDAMLVVCYEPSPAETRAAVTRYANDLGLRLSGDLVDQMVSNMGHAEGPIHRELEKMALYCDAGPENPQTVDAETIQLLGVANEEENLDTIYHSALEGELSTLGRELIEVHHIGLSEHGLLRLLIMHLSKLIELRGRVDQGMTPKMAVDQMRPPIHFRIKGNVMRQLSIWPAADLARLIERLGNIEITLKSAGASPAALVEQELLAIARRARKLRH